jgi:hypothetical protein
VLDLSSLDLQPRALFQYVDNLLLCSPTLTQSQDHTALLLNFLAQKGYQVHLSLPQIKYLGVLLTPTSRQIAVDRKAYIR